MALGQRRELTTALYLKGAKQAEIADQLGVNVSTVCRDLQRIHQYWIASGIRDFDAIKVEQVRNTDTVEAEAQGRLGAEPTAGPRTSRASPCGPSLTSSPS